MKSVTLNHIQFHLYNSVEMNFSRLLGVYSVARQQQQQPRRDVRRCGDRGLYRYLYK